MLPASRGYVGPYVGRFAPTPSGPLHAGSLVAALASWLDARAHEGRWLLRFDDLDGPRSMPGIEHLIVQQLTAVGLEADAPPLWQSQRGALYAQALEHLRARGLAYPCGCTRRDIDVELAALGMPAERGAERVYPGTCRQGLNGKAPRVLSKFRAARAICRSLLVHDILAADSRAAWTAGKSRATSTPMMAMTTSNSTSVKPRCVKER